VTRVLIIDDVHTLLIDGLRAEGYEVDYMPESDQRQILEMIHLYDGLVVRTKMHIDKSVLLKATQLKFIGRAGAGLDNIDTDYCDAHGIQYFNAGEANADAVGEHTLAMLLSLCTRLQKADKEVRSLKWDREGNRGWELKGKTIGIIGYGNTGRAVARKLAGFEVNVIAYDKYLQQLPDSYATQTDMATLQQQADIITLHVPLNAETRHMINKEWIAGCEKNIVLLNLSRGKVANVADVVNGLKEGKITACGLDVLENEKLDTLDATQKVSFGYLRSADNVVLSPHVGGWTMESYEKISNVLLRKIKELTHHGKNN
jgi:D-3-phosphoglycerate dehydrogenase